MLKRLFQPGGRAWPVIAAVLVTATVVWAGTQVFAPPARVESAAAFTTSTVREGTVESVVTLNTSAIWQATATGRNRAVGTITSVDLAADAEAQPGDVLYSVDMRPVSIGAGTVPAYRDLAAGSSGPDVAQLQSLLTTTGFYTGAIDGQFSSRTTAAVRAWQDARGVDENGVVGVADIIYVPSLPVKVVLDSELITVGNSLAGGEAVVSSLGTSPEFAIAVGEEQAALVPLGTTVLIESFAGDTEWTATAVDVVTDEAQQMWIVLGPEGSDPICGAECASIPTGGENLLPSKVITVPRTTGLVVPTAALKSDVDGSVSVIDEAGNLHPVRVVLSARGTSIVEGVTAGMKVRVPAAGTDAQR